MALHNGARAVAMLGEYLRALAAQPVDRVVPDDVRRRVMTQPYLRIFRSAEEALDWLIDAEECVSAG